MWYLCPSLVSYSSLRISSWIIKTAAFIIHLIQLQQMFCTGLLPRDDGIEQTPLSRGEARKQGPGFHPKELAPATSTVLNPPHAGSHLTTGLVLHIPLVALTSKAWAHMSEYGYKQHPFHPFPIHCSVCINPITKGETRHHANLSLKPYTLHSLGKYGCW